MSGRLLQAAAPMFAAALTAGGCYGAGVVALRWSQAKLDRFERVPLAFLVGAGCMHLAIFAVMAAKLAYKPVWWILLGGAMVWAAAVRTKGHEESRAAPDVRLRVIFGAIFIPFTVLYLVNAWVPETSPDGSAYHLKIVADYLRAHGFVRITTNMYADLTQGVEMLYEPAFAFGKHSAAALVHFTFLIAFGMAIYAYGRRIGKPWVGAAAAALVYLCPVVGRDGTTAYVDVATAAIVFGAFYALEIWDEQRTTGTLAIAGLMTGYAFTAKYTMFVMTIYGVLFVVWRARRVRPVLVFTAAATVMIAPWLIKNWIYLQDPVAPFLTRIFPSPYVHTLVVEEWAAYLRHYDVPNLRQLPLEVTVRGGWTQGLLGPIFLLAPLGLLALRDRLGRRVLLVGAVLLAPYYGNLGTRFLIPCIPFFALAMALAVERWKVALVAISLIQAVTAWPDVMPRYAKEYSWRLEESPFPYQAALRIKPEQEYLHGRLSEMDMLRLIEEKTEPKAQVLALTSTPISYTSRNLFEPSQGALNDTLGDFLNVARIEDFQPSRVLVFHFAEQSTDQIRVVQTATAKSPEQWNVHELRFYHQGVEIPRQRAWRLSAWPNPFEIQLAFDNSGVTRWRSWQTGEPGMYININFGRPESVDEVRMWTSPDWHWPFKFEIQAGGRKITDQFEEKEQKQENFLGYAATREILARGVGYILIAEDDRSADDFADNSEAWGLEVVGRAGSLFLYRIVP